MDPDQNESSRNRKRKKAASPQPGPSRLAHHQYIDSGDDQDDEGVSVHDFDPYGSDQNITPPLQPPSSRRRRTRLTFDNVDEIDLKTAMPAYSYYYPDKPPDLPEPEKKVLAIERFLLEDEFHRKWKATRSRYRIESNEETTFSINYEQVTANEEFLREWPDFPINMVNHTAETIQLWNATAHMLLSKTGANPPSDEDNNSANNDEVVDATIPLRIMRIRLGFLKPHPVLPIKNLSTSFIDQFVTISGSVCSAENIRPWICRLTFKCRVCEESFTVEQKTGVCTFPDVCKASEDCNNTKGFIMEEDAATTIYTDSRRIRIQDMSQTDIERGSIPKSIDCLLVGGWVDQCQTGDLVKICGIYKISDNFVSKQSKHAPYIQVFCIERVKDSQRNLNTGSHILDLSTTDHEAIAKIYDEPRLFRLIVASFCPSVYGHDIIKAGLLLCLFGGTCNNKEGTPATRSDINLIMIGDAGIGKSQLLSIVKDVAPKAVYVCGTTSSVAGLTATLSKDGDDYTLEGGALVLADNGLICIDEFDKMSSQQAALLEGMEQHSVSVAKCGVQRTLPARTTVIAAANPIGGHYRKNKTINENINIKSAVLSRFDLIFILLDTPNQKFDHGLVKHHKTTIILDNNSTPIGSDNIESDRENAGTASSNQSRSSTRSVEPTLLDKLKFGTGEVVDLIPHPLLRKYISYAKQYVFPKLSQEAAHILTTYYLELRNERQLTESIPVTARQLQSLKRLAEARAKAELRELVTSNDAKDAVYIFKSSLCKKFENEAHVAPSVSPPKKAFPGRKKSVKGQAEQLFQELLRVAKDENRNTFSVDEIKATIRTLGYEHNSAVLIATLNDQGYLLLECSGFYKILITHF